MATTTAAPQAPGPPSWALLPELLRLRDQPLTWVLERQRSYGDVFSLRPPVGLLGPEFLWACSPDTVHDVLTDTATFEKSSPVYEEMAAALGDGLLTSEGERWKAQRRTLQPLFTKRRVASYAGSFADAARQVVDGWSDEATVDLDAEMQLVSLGAVSMTLFGTDVTDQVAPIVEATGLLSRRTVERGLSPVRLPRWLPLPTNRRMDAAEQELIRRVDALIDARADGEVSTTGRRDDLVSLLLDATDPETGQGLSRQEIREQALIFLLAGHDTTSTAMTFALRLLGLHRDIQDDVRSEIRQVAPDGPIPGEAAGDLDLTRRVIDEAMRLYPPAYITSRRATRATAVGGYAVPEGGVVATSFYALHRHPEVWEQPHRFDPDRFLPDRVKARNRYAHLPFGAGPRTCIGNHFALLEATMTLATVIRDWRIDADAAEPPLSLGITLRPAAPVPAVVCRA